MAVEDPRLEKLRSKDEVIGTMTARDLIKSPDFVYQRYREHAETHMSLGNTSDYVSRLLQWTRINKGAVIGGISGKYGYGKTSMASPLWHHCDQARVIAVPPFVWYRLQDIVDATWAWVSYKVSHIEPGAITRLGSVYEKYREQSIQEFAEEMDLSVSKVQELSDAGKVHLDASSDQVIAFLSEISEMLEGPSLQLYGPIVFTDELQVTLSRYQKRGLSRDEFMQDVYELLNPLIEKAGSFGMIVGLPLPTEALVTDVRPDILQRLQFRRLFIRPNTMYEREFPAELWSKFAELYEFEDIADLVLPADTLDSIGQIAFRDDLGAGPRTVIEAMRAAIAHYDQVGQSLSPVHLMDEYLSHQIAFDSGGKLIAAVSEVLQSKDIQEIPDADRVVKLMAAFPMGCAEERFDAYGLQNAKDELSKRLYTEYLYTFPEGVSLRKLAPTERSAQPRFIELTKEFIQTYAESHRELQVAVEVFRKEIVEGRLLTSRRTDQIDGWIPDSKSNQWIGTFDHKFPDRRLAVRVSLERAEVVGELDEFGLAFWFDPGCDSDASGKIERSEEQPTLAIFCLNLLRRPSGPLNLPYLEEHGYPTKKVSPAFMMALVHHLRANEQIVPEDEKRIQMEPFIRRLIDYSIQLLLGEELMEKAQFKGLSKVGLALPKEVFSRMCRERYSRYETLITTGRWEPAMTAYVNALASQAVSSSIGVLRGNRPLEVRQREALTLFGETRVQTFKGLVENLSNVLDVSLGPRADAPSTVRFKLHPAEERFMEALRDSEKKLARDQVQLRVLGQYAGLELLQNFGFRDKEIQYLLILLKTRRLVDHDAKRQYFVEVLESPDERREAILAILSDLSKQADILATIPDFDREYYLAETTRLLHQVETCNDVEILEEHQAQLTLLRETLAQFSRNWADRIQTNFEQVRHATGQAMRTSLPADLARPLKGDVAWVGELVKCQALLKEKFQRSLAAFRAVESRVTSAWNAWTGATTNDPAALLALYEANLSAQSELVDAKTSMAAALAYLQAYSAWANVLNTASRAYREASQCEASYSEDEFRVELDAVFARIGDRFQHERLEALPHHEMYLDEIKSTQNRIDTWLRDRRERFMQAKRFYEETLKDFGVDPSNLRAGFDAFDLDTSRDNMYSEVSEKTWAYLELLERRLTRDHTDVLYAKTVVSADVTEPAAQIDTITNELARVKGQAVGECIREHECFASLGDALQGLGNALNDLEQSLRGILQKRPPTPEEEAVLRLLQDPRGTDFSVVIASRLMVDSSEFPLDELVQTIVSLFRKNQIIIRLEKRR